MSIWSCHQYMAGYHVSPSGGDEARHFCLLATTRLSSIGFYTKPSAFFRTLPKFFESFANTLGFTHSFPTTGNISLSGSVSFLGNTFGGPASHKVCTHPHSGEVCGARNFHHLSHLRSRFHFCVHFSSLRLYFRP